MLLLLLLLLLKKVNAAVVHRKRICSRRYACCQNTNKCYKVCKDGACVVHSKAFQIDILKGSGFLKGRVRFARSNRRLALPKPSASRVEHEALQTHAASNKTLVPRQVLATCASGDGECALKTDLGSVQLEDGQPIKYFFFFLSQSAPKW